MRKGFKSHAENVALDLRRKMKLSEIAPLPMRELARHLGVPVITPDVLPGLSQKELQILTGDNGWSALCMAISNGHLIIHNSSHPAVRQESNIAHELSHILCDHAPDKIVHLGSNLYTRTFDESQEDEATYLGGCIQLPQRALVSCLFRGMDKESISKDFQASLPMVNYRINITGAANIVSRSRFKKKLFSRV